MIEWIPVADSERIVAMAHDEEREAIYVRFPDGVEWYYDACPSSVWAEFTAVGVSKGSYIARVLDHKPNGRLT